jgi:hypothetical protein
MPAAKPANFVVLAELLSWRYMSHTSKRTHMAQSASAKDGRERVRHYRERLRRQGLRPLQIWVPDTRSPAFAAEAHRQSAAVSASLHEAEDQAFIDAISDRAG